MVWPNPFEVAELTINGMKYTDWETVNVKHELKQNPYYSFRFTCSEGMPLAKNWAALRIRPGDYCTITLGGQPAFNGFVSTRQVFYDAHRHHIEIQGTAPTLSLSYATVIHKSHEHNNTTYLKYANELLKPFKIPLTVEGGSLPNIVFPRLSNAPSTKVMEALELPLRALGHFDFTSNVQGHLVILASTPVGGVDTLSEGREILEGREIIFDPGIASGNFTFGQQPGGDEKHASAVSHEPFDVGRAVAQASQFVPQSFPLEVPAYLQALMAGRNLADERWQGQTKITLHITVQGWMRPSGGLWYRGQQVNVISPMLIMDGDENLILKSATFTQDSQRGTRTVLELCNPNAMQVVPGEGST